MAERSRRSPGAWMAGLVLIALSMAFMPFTLEDTWIFLAIAREFPSQDGLRGATSLSWGMLAVLAQAVAGPSDATWVLKVFSATCWLLAGLCTLRAVTTVRPDVSALRIALVFGLMSPTIWSWSGMDTAWSMLWASACLWMLAVSRVGQHRRFPAELTLAALLGAAYLVRPEMLWVGPLWLLWVRSKVPAARWVWLCAVTLAMLAVSVWGYNGLTGSFTPTSSSKIGLPGVVTLISVAWFIVQAVPLAVSARGAPAPLRGDASQLWVVILAVVALRLAEHAVLGGIDHRPLAVLMPCLVMAWALIAPHRLSKAAAALLWVPMMVLYALNVDNARWYAQRTEAVHQQVLQSLAGLPGDLVVGTDEVGLVSYRFGISRVLDHHHLIGRGLSSLLDADVLVFTGNLRQADAMEAGFQAVQTYCFESRPTVYVRSVGMTPRAYCKTLYQR